jgi:hypothetical protein
MTMNEYRANIDRWHQIASMSNITLSDGRPLPITFWKTFLGLKRKVHLDLYNGKHKVSSGLVMAYVARSIYFANNLSEDAFMNEVRSAVEDYEKDKRS